jgi:YHS domain-containing protein
VLLMLMRFINWRTGCLAAAVGLMVVAGCGKEEPAKTDTGAKPEEVAGLVKEKAAEGEAEIEAQLQAKLAKADELDGTTDKIVERCPGCGLSMDGKSEYAVEVAGYTLHFCSESCKEDFTEDLTQAVLDLKIPED